MRGQGAFTCAVVALHLLLLVSAETRQPNLLKVQEKSCNVEKNILPRINLAEVWADGNYRCLRLSLQIKPLLVNETLQIKLMELASGSSSTLLIQRGHHGNNTVWWKLLSGDQSKEVKIRNRSTNRNHLDIRSVLVWKLRYECFMTREGETVNVAVDDFNGTLVSDSYTVKHKSEDVQIPMYQVASEIFAKRITVEMEAGQKVCVRLCYENNGMCYGIISHLIDTDLNQTLTLNVPYLLPCVCVQIYYNTVDAIRHTTCPLKDKILPGGGEVLSSSSVQLFGNSVLTWKHLCPSAQFRPVVSLCWQQARIHSRCISVQNSTLHMMTDLKYNVTDVDKHANMCVKFLLNGSHHVFCPFSSGYLSEWDVTVIPGSRLLYIHLSSNIPASFAAQLCVEKGGQCVPKANVHTVQVQEGARDVVLDVPLPFFTSQECVQVWRTDPALRGRRIICPNYTHRRWGLIAAALMAFLVAITTIRILTYKLIKRQTSAWRSAKRKPVLLVCSSDESSHVAAVCALACGLEEELRMDVRLAQWTQCSSQTSLAQLGPAPWLYGQCQEVHSVGGMVLIAWSPEAQQTFLRWREGESKGEVGTDLKDKVVLEEFRDKQRENRAKNQSSLTAPVFNATLIRLWAGLQSGTHGQGFGLVCFRGLSGPRCIPKEFRGIRRYCLPRDLSNLIHELDVNVPRNVPGPRNRAQSMSHWCCWPRLFSKGHSFWLSQRLARRLDSRLPQTTAKPKRKCLPKVSGKVKKGEKMEKVEEGKILSSSCSTGQSRK